MNKEFNNVDINVFVSFSGFCSSHKQELIIYCNSLLLFINRIFIYYLD